MVENAEDFHVSGRLSKEDATFRQDKLEKLLDNILTQEPPRDARASQELIRYIKDELSAVYLDNERAHQVFRHSYSGVTSFMVSASQPASTQPSQAGAIKDDVESGRNLPVRLSESSAFLVNYLNAVRDDVVRYGPTALLPALDKLIDHIQLETIRIDLLTRTADDVGTRMASNQQQLDVATSKIKKLEKTLKKEQRVLDDIQREYIGILGIFSAVALIANGGISIGSATIAASSKYHVLSSAFLISIVGFFLFNIFYALMSFIFNIVNRGSQDDEDSTDGMLFRATAWFNKSGVMSHSAFVAIDVALATLVVILLVLTLNTP